MNYVRSSLHVFAPTGEWSWPKMFGTPFQPTKPVFYFAGAIRCIPIFIHLNNKNTNNKILFRLKAGGVGCRIPTKKTTLNPEHRERRLNWARERVGAGMDLWDRVVKSDKFTFRSDRNGTQHLWRTTGTRWAFFYYFFIILYWTIAAQELHRLEGLPRLLNPDISLILKLNLLKLVMWKSLLLA